MPTAAELRRARPLLGTLVEIAVPAGPAAVSAVDRAFAAITRVHQLMNAHDETSDLGRLARARSGRRVALHAWTWRVIAAAQRFAEQSGGAFDPVAIASDGRATWRDLQLGEDRRSASCSRRLRVDLGGIAKGFAVDQAVRALRRAGCAWGLVNAGGDMRAFGPRAWPLHVRHPGAPGHLVAFDRLTDDAATTSAPYFTERRENDRTVSALRDARCGTFAHGPVSVTVRARTALAADALTKVVLFCDPATAARVLHLHNARAVLHRIEEDVRDAG